MIYLSTIELLLWCICICFVLALLIHVLWMSFNKSQDKPAAGRLICGMLASGGITGFFVFLLMLYVLPSVYLVEHDDYSTKRFISSDWSNQLTKEYIDNKAGVPLRFEAVGYGNKKHINHSITIPVDTFKEVEDGIDGYNTSPPMSISSRSKGEVRWYLYHDN